MSNNFRRTALGALALVTAITLTACGLSSGETESSGDTDPGVNLETKTINIGSFVPETGPVPNYKLIATGSKAYADWVNANGGINGWKLEYSQLDDGYDPARSLSVTRELVERKDVFALVAPIGTPTVAAVVDYAVKQELPVIGAVSGQPELPGLENFFILLPNYFDEAKLDVTYAAEELGATKVAVLYQNDDLGKPALEGAKAAVEELGLELVTEASFNVSDTDLTAQITQARDAGADVTLLWGSNGNVATGVTTAERLGFETQFFAPFYTADPTTYELAGDALDGTMFGSWLLPTSDQSESVVAFKEQMDSAGKSGELGVFSMNGWTNAALFGAGLEKITADGATPTRQALIDALSEFTDVPVGGSPAVTFTKDNHAGTRSLTVVQAGDETFKALTDPIPFD